MQITYCYFERDLKDTRVSANLHTLDKHLGSPEQHDSKKHGSSRMWPVRIAAMQCFVLIALLCAVSHASALEIAGGKLLARKLAQTTVTLTQNATSKALPPPPPPPRPVTANPDDVLKMNCSAWPEPRRYLEVASWWTPESASGGPLSPSGSSHRVSVGACVPSGIIRSSKLVVDVGIKLANCLSSNKYIDSIWLNLLGTTMAKEDGLGFYCCGTALCQQTIRYELDLSVLGRNGNGTWEMGLQIVGPSTDRLEYNKYANAQVSLPVSVVLPTVNVTSTEALSNQLQVNGWGHGPWNTRYVTLTGVPSAIWPAYGSMVPLALQMYKWPDGVYYNQQASNITSFVASLNPTSSNVVGTPIMQYSRINISGLYQTPFIDATPTSNLPNGTNLFAVRVDSYVPTSAMPQNFTLPAVQRTGGTFSVSYTLGWKK